MIQDHLRLVQRVAARQTSQEIEGLLALFTDDVVYEDVPFEIVKRSAVEAKELFEGTWASLPDFAMTMRSVVVDEDRGAMEWVMSGTHLGDFLEYPASGRYFSLRAAAIMRFSNGRISHWTDYWSLSSFKEQLGFAECRISRHRTRSSSCAQNRVYPTCLSRPGRTQSRTDPKEKKHAQPRRGWIERYRALEALLRRGAWGGRADAQQNGHGHTRLFYRHDGSTFCVSEPINDEPVTCANGSTVAFKCGSPEQVLEFHDTAVAHGGTSIEDAPGLRNSGRGPIHLTYVRDPDGNKLCAIHRDK